MGAFKANIQGLDRVLARIANIDEALATKVDKEIGQAAINIANTARSLVPGGAGELSNSIGVDQSQHNERIVGTPLLFGAYVEFGTGEFVFITPVAFTEEQKEFAKQFYVNGKGRMPASPYLFPALAEETPKVLQRIRTLLFGNI